MSKLAEWDGDCRRLARAFADADPETYAWIKSDIERKCEDEFRQKIQKARSELKSKGLKLICQKCGEQAFVGFDGDNRVRCISCKFKTTHTKVLRANIDRIFEEVFG